MDVPAPLDSDLGVYVASGLLAVLAFVVGVTVLVTTGRITPGSRLFTGLVVGFSLFLGSYFVALWIYRFVDRRMDSAASNRPDAR